MIYLHDGIYINPANISEVVVKEKKDRIMSGDCSGYYNTYDVLVTVIMNSGSKIERWFSTIESANKFITIFDIKYYERY